MIVGQKYIHDMRDNADYHLIVYSMGADIDKFAEKEPDIFTVLRELTISGMPAVEVKNQNGNHSFILESSSTYRNAKEYTE